MSKDLLLAIFKMAKKKRILDKELIEFLENVFPGRSSNVIEVLKRGITKIIYKPSNRIVWTAMGENQEHLIYPNLFCSCQDFYKSVIIKRERFVCKHLIAQIISEALNNYQIKELEDNEFSNLIKDLKLQI
ncbi:MAG: hypothetical protein ACFE9T_13880 [Promethearchaeota archaeon]